MDELEQNIIHGEPQDVIDMLDQMGINKDNINTLPPLNDINNTILHLACSRGILSIVQNICERGADINAVDTTNATPLSYSAIYGFSDIVIYLSSLPGINPNIVRTGPKFGGESPLMHAAWKCSFEAVEALINAGADVNAERSVGDHFTVLMYSTYNTVGKDDLEKMKITVNKMDLLIRAGADIHARRVNINKYEVNDKRGNTAAILFARRFPWYGSKLSNHPKTLFLGQLLTTLKKYKSGEIASGETPSNETGGSRKTRKSRKLRRINRSRKLIK